METSAASTTGNISSLLHQHPASVSPICGSPSSIPPKSHIHHTVNVRNQMCSCQQQLSAMSEICRIICHSIIVFMKMAFNVMMGVGKIFILSENPNPERFQKGGGISCICVTLVALLLLCSVKQIAEGLCLVSPKGEVNRIWIK